MNVPKFLRTVEDERQEPGLGERARSIEEAMSRELTSAELPHQAPSAPPPSLDNVSDLVAKGIKALVEEHTSLLERAKECFLQVEACLTAAQEAKTAMISARKEALGPALPDLHRQGGEMSDHPAKSEQK